MVEIPEFAGDIFGNILNITVLSIIGIFVLALIGFLLYHFLVYRKKFNIDVKIISQRAGDPNIILDKAAILYDRKKKTKFFKLLKSKVELESPPFKIMQTTNKGDYIELYRKSEDNFMFLTKPKIDEKWLIKADGKLYPMASSKQRQIEGDYHWLMTRLQQDKDWISPEGFFSKLLQMMPILIPSAIMIILFLFFLNALPEILGKLSQVIEKLATLEGVATKS